MTPQRTPTYRVQLVVRKVRKVRLVLLVRKEHKEHKEHKERSLLVRLPSTLQTSRHFQLLLLLRRTW